MRGATGRLRVLVTGAAGFIGCHTAARLAAEGHEVVGLDNLSRPGTALNARWLEQTAGIAVLRCDLRSARAVQRLVKRQGPFDGVVHLAAQVAVTTSLKRPRLDLATNLLGTFNLLEALRVQGRVARRRDQRPILIYASTNKVYGPLAHWEVEELPTRYRWLRRPEGVDEQTPLDLHTPYACSKGAAELYVLDYARSFGLPGVVFRQSCIYGTRQFGNEDQGWVAWFLIASLLGRPITVYGSGKQVRDLLYADDLVELFARALVRGRELAGEAFNAGGGPERSLSLLELLDWIRGSLGLQPEIRFGPPRRADPRVYISDIRKVQRAYDWTPAVSVDDGLRRVASWVAANRDLFSAPSRSGPRTSGRPCGSAP